MRSCTRLRLAAKRRRANFERARESPALKVTLKLRMLCAAGSRLVEKLGVSYDPPHSGRIWGFGLAFMRIRDDSIVLPVV